MDPNGIDQQTADPAKPIGADGGDILGLLGTRPLTPSEMEMALRLVSDNGNEGFLATLGEMASVSSGKLGLMREGAQAIDNSVAARSGSRTYNISASERIQEDELAPANEDVTAAMTALFEQGVSGREMAEALEGIDPLDTRATMQAMAGVAQNNELADAHPVIEAAVIDSQVNQVATVAAEQEAAAQAVLAQEPNPYELNGTDPNMAGPAAPART